MTATTSPRRTARSTSPSAVTLVEADGHPSRALARTGTVVATGGDAGAGGGSARARRSRSAPARRRASRTDSGSGDQPANRPRSTSGGATGDTSMISSAAADPECGAPPGHQHHRVGEGQNPLQAVFGEQHGEAEVVDEPRQRVEHVLGGRRIECRRRLVEDEYPGRRRQHRPDGHALLLTSGQGGQRTVSHLVQAQQVEGVLDPATHHPGGDPEVLHGVGQLVLDHVGHERGGGILAHHADHVGQLAGRKCTGGPPVDRDLAGESSAGEVRHQPVDGTEQGRLARSGGAHHHAQLALPDHEVDPVERRRVGAWS